ncbi:MAG: hypothetical protein SRB2_00121 [Desulfobacteraceae bacterium Eth-SRB2]|nr:MAG: hypothetical protein SRB2_00121 [Desulfobacteraceae bacterium Eth-SRB2]
MKKLMARILIKDDNARILKMLRQILEREWVDVMKASSVFIIY